MKKARKVKGEGWDVFTTDGSAGHEVIELMKLDDPWRGDKQLRPCFRGDKQAIEHVVACAKRGDPVAIDALWLADQDDLIHTILWEDFWRKHLCTRGK